MILIIKLNWEILLKLYIQKERKTLQLKREKSAKGTNGHIKRRI